MKLLFVHSHKFVVGDDAKVYTTGSLPYAGVLERYLSVFNELIVVGRRRSPVTGETSRLALASGKDVEFCLVPGGVGLGARARRIAMLEGQIRKADAVLVRLPSGIGIHAANIATRLGKPWAVEVVGSARDALRYHGSMAGRVYALKAERDMKRVVAQSKFALYVTREYLQRTYPSPGYTTSASNVVIPHLEESVLSQRLGRSDSSIFTIGLIGYINARYKGIETALRAIASVRQDLPPFCFRILGNGNPDMWAKLIRRLDLQDNVFFDGVLPSGGPVFDWLDKVDLYLQPSFTEGLPRALLEAMSRGCPALASDVGGIPEILSDDCMHKPGDWPTLGQMILKASVDAAWREHQTRRNFHVAQQYTRNSIEAARREFLTMLAASTRGQ